MKMKVIYQKKFKTKKFHSSTKTKLKKKKKDNEKIKFKIT